MNHPERIEDYLEHIAEAIARATQCIAQTEDLAAFARDLRTQDAVVRNIEILGEAVAKIQKLAPNFIAEHPELPWCKCAQCATL